MAEFKREIALGSFEAHGLALSDFENEIRKALEKQGWNATVTRIKDIRRVSGRGKTFVRIVGSLEIVLTENK